MQSPSIHPQSRLCRNAALSILALAACAAPAIRAQSLLGSHESLMKQNDEAREHDFTYLRTAGDVRDYAQQGVLVRCPGNADYELATEEVSFPYARPEVKLFIERLADQYHESCGEPLVVTSLTRPISRQPPNASAISVHPTGMAVDLRRSDSPGCRQWLETVLLDLEGKGVIEATREQYPPHYHVAVFPNPYLQYVASGQELPKIEVARSTGRETSSRVRYAKSGRHRHGRGRTHAAVAASHRHGHRASGHRRSGVVRAANHGHRRHVSPRHHTTIARASHSRHSRSAQSRSVASR
ncbi:MAG TPA: DUF5715 family protein [Thermoanaerobaculia bacterium]